MDITARPTDSALDGPVSNKRKDFNVAETIKTKAVTPTGVNHKLKVARYRDKLLNALRDTVDRPLFNLLDRRSIEVLGAKAANTEISYYSDMLAYVRFCSSERLTPLPFLERSLDTYLSNMMVAGKKRGTIDRHVASLAYWAQLLELDDPRKSFVVKTRLEKIRRKLPTRTRQAEGLRAAQLEQALTLLNPDVPRDCQDITLLFVGFETLCRQSELVEFNWGDLEKQADGSSLLHLKQSKTDQYRDGEWVFLSATTTALLLGWQAVSNPDHKMGPIFRGIYSDGNMGRRLSTRGVQRCYKRIAKRLGLSPAVFSGHSTRVGAAQEMVERNIDSAKIMLSGRWKTMTMLTRYSKKIRASKSGMADLTQQLQWNGPTGHDKAKDKNLINAYNPNELAHE